MITPGYQGRALIELLQNAGCPETYERKVRTFVSAEGLRVQEVVLRRRMRLIMVRTQIDEATAREAIERADDARVMSKAWSSWRGTAEVSVAVPAGDPLDAGRLCALLPMADEAPCPVPGFVNAPFFTTFELRRPRSSTCCAGARRGCTGWSP
ncbi:hypothetical protein [Streptomyces sp. NPDC002722]|uniref:hypothetical protein n=2 Tax=unclassified Streptomyces TaxID=2593676 RepID=UPI003326A279